MTKDDLTAVDPMIVKKVGYLKEFVNSDGWKLIKEEIRNKSTIIRLPSAPRRKCLSTKLTTAVERCSHSMAFSATPTIFLNL